ncbi:hypothetical protein F8388_023107 [Cannabis sativa]|uniref:F-box domain-containing protein n=1 Tax=Cannabis sativa TaxID=3483 RepID=A0A7J6FM82_CANSA|nr:hypothetical protein F8388_023107 [Cannabis sativa]
MCFCSVNLIVGRRLILFLKMPKVDNSGDFIFWFAEEISIKILTYLDDPSDVVRVSSVSKLWRQFVIEHDICKQLCLKKFPEISGAVELNNLIEPVDIGLRNGTEFELLKRNHKIFSFLAKALSPVITNDCLSTAISASSTDNYPTESIVHTLQPGDRNQNHRYPIYSCKAVRFKMGHLRNLGESDTDFSDNESEDHTLLDDRFVWTYISPEFPMVQELDVSCGRWGQSPGHSRFRQWSAWFFFLLTCSIIRKILVSPFSLQESFLQKFELPEPALCVGGYLLVELLGRCLNLLVSNEVIPVLFIKASLDDRVILSIAHVQIVGRPLLPTFDVEMHEPSGKCLLKHYSETITNSCKVMSENKWLWKYFTINPASPASPLKLLLCAPQILSYTRSKLQKGRCIILEAKFQLIMNNHTISVQSSRNVNINNRKRQHSQIISE